MLFTIVFFYVGPVIVLFGLGVVSLYLTFSDYFSTRRIAGWTFLAISCAIFMTTAAGRAAIDSSAGALLHIILLGILISMQIPLAVELISQAVIPDPSKGLKVTSDHSEVEAIVVKGDLEKAIIKYEKIIANNSRDVVARFKLAELYYEKGEYLAAAANYERTLASSEKIGTDRHCSTLTRLAEIYYRHLGDVETARRHMQTIMKKYPGTRYAVYATEYLDNLRILDGTS
jgi:tetratricopeptide (TPR) repeat protein